MSLPALDSTDSQALLELLEKMTADASQIQDDLLQQILTTNANTQYLKGFLNGYSDKQLFKKAVPVVEYQDIEPFVDRIANGESSHLISSHPITELLLSSGTSGGKRKAIPTTAEEPRRRAFYASLTATILNKHIEFWNQGKQMNFRFIMPEMTTLGGLVVTNAVSSNFRRSRIQNRSNCWNNDTSPDEVILCEDIKQSMYCQLLCGLVQRDAVVRIGTTYASGFLRVIKFLEEHWQELCSNIKTGNISDWVIDPGCQKAVSLILSQQMPDLADSIEIECRSGSWGGIVKRLWPRTKCIEVVSTGTMTQYIPNLEFYCGGVPLVSMYYAASEGFFGLNLKPLSDPYNVSYTLVPWMAYYEFLRLGHKQDHSQDNDTNCMSTLGELVDLVNVQIGQQYELVVTTFTGLYRYRVGDVLMVTDFRNDTPQFKVVQRRNVVLSIDLDKTTEEGLLKAVSKAMQILEPLGCLLTDYSSYADVSCFPGHYVLFWELQMRENAGTAAVLERVQMEGCCNVVEESLDGMYKTLRRRSNVIDPLEIRVVKRGTFDGLMDLFLSEGASLNQYKTPKRIKSEKAIQFLNSMVVETFFSRVLPAFPPTG
ncbi:indole-3-acetic acid-amido synthetase GH3.17-like [Coffea eugenioides]|uniref:indole-3-acetic acid-amido synthetase GH3.17-like n=1 Tax=Coffea eugenioides TaxID=49369 RepID=UPI000F60BA41|nr:indole-3-acetic acid-amido synthetase GH3.17-like [Coffea eugenioides]